MNTLVLSRRPAYPPRNGRQQRVWEECRHFATAGEVVLATPPSEESVPLDSVRQLPLATRFLTSQYSLFHLWNASHLLGSANVYHRLLSDRVVAAVDSNELAVGGETRPIDLVTSDSPQLHTAAALLADRYDAKHLLSKHNAAYTLLDAYLESIPLPALVRSRAVRSLRRLEQTAIDRADAVVFHSKTDGELFDVSAGTISAHVPNGTNYEAIAAGGDPGAVRERLGIPADAFVCVYVGSYDYFANREAAMAIAEEFAAALPDVTFLLVGQDPPTVNRANVYAPGYVEDLPGALALADLALCPLESGAGTKLKMLDYLAAGLPTVTTELGASGIDVVDETSALVRDRTGFVAAIERLRDDPVLREKLAENARELGKRYDWSVLLQEYDAILKQLLDGEYGV